MAATGRRGWSLRNRRQNIGAEVAKFPGTNLVLPRRRCLPHLLSLHLRPLGPSVIRTAPTTPAFILPTTPSRSTGSALLSRSPSRTPSLPPSRTSCPSSRCFRPLPALLYPSSTRAGCAYAPYTMLSRLTGLVLRSRGRLCRRAAASFQANSTGCRNLRSIGKAGYKGESYIYANTMRATQRRAHGQFSHYAPRK